MIDVRVLHGDVLAMLGTLADASVDAVVTDPPYGLADHRPAELVTALTAWIGGDRVHVPDGRGFMGNDWDAFVPPPAVWDECMRVLKPGGHLLAFAGSRTYDLMGMSIRLSGFEIRDGLQWLYGSGFPKGQDVGKAIDKAAGAVREVVGIGPNASRRPRADHGSQGLTFADDAYVRPAGDVVTAPATAEAERWQGWNTSLKPAHEPIVLARKPLSGTVAASILEHGTGALNVDGCRVAMSTADPRRAWQAKYGGCDYGEATNTVYDALPSRTSAGNPAGRWPANVLLSHDPQCNGRCAPGCPVADLDAQSGTLTSGKPGTHRAGMNTSAALGAESRAPGTPMVGFGDSGGASRFFPTFRYQAKAPASERPKIDGKGWPTVKPLALMRWLVRLVTPPGGVVLDPFAGTGTTLAAARAEGFYAIGIERDPFAQALLAQRLALPPTESETEDDTVAVQNADARQPSNPGGPRRDDFEDFQRDRHKRPKIIRAVLDPNTGRWEVPRDVHGDPVHELVSFTRASTLGGAIEFQGGLHRWKAAVAVWGACRSRTLGKRARAVDGYSRRDQKDELYEIVDKAQAFAESDSAANHGTALHSIFQRIAEGETVQQLVDQGAIDQDDVPACTAFADALSRWDVLYCERRVVCDEAQAAGKYDLIVTARRPMPVTDAAGRVVDVILPGERICVDNKTSSSADYFGEKFAVQLWVYAHGRDYDKVTGERTEVGCSKRWALILHVPSGTDEATASATWHWVDLSIGAELVKTARAVLEGRKRGKAAIITANLDAEVPPELLERRMREVAEGDGSVPMHLAADVDQELTEYQASLTAQQREVLAGQGQTVGELMDAKPGCPTCAQWHPAGTTCPDSYLSCQLCNHDQHSCRGCGSPTPHERDDVASACPDCLAGAQADGIELLAPDPGGPHKGDDYDAERAPTSNGTANLAIRQDLGQHLQRTATIERLIRTIARAATVAELLDLYQRADGAGYATDEVRAACTARKQALRNGVPA